MIARFFLAITFFSLMTVFMDIFSQRVRKLLKKRSSRVSVYSVSESTESRPVITVAAPDDSHHIRSESEGGSVLKLQIKTKYCQFHPYFSFSTGFLTILIHAGCLSIISFFIKKYRGSFVLAETHLDWQVSFMGMYSVAKKAR